MSQGTARASAPAGASFSPGVGADDGASGGCDCSGGVLALVSTLSGTLSALLYLLFLVPFAVYKPWEPASPYWAPQAALVRLNSGFALPHDACFGQWSQSGFFQMCTRLATSDDVTAVMAGQPVPSGPGTGAVLDYPKYALPDGIGGNACPSAQLLQQRYPSCSWTDKYDVRAGTRVLDETPGFVRADVLSAECCGGGDTNRAGCPADDTGTATLIAGLSHATDRLACVYFKAEESTRFAQRHALGTLPAAVGYQALPLALLLWLAVRELAKLAGLSALCWELRVRKQRREVRRRGVPLNAASPSAAADSNGVAIAVNGPGSGAGAGAGGDSSVSGIGNCGCVVFDRDCDPRTSRGMCCYHVLCCPCSVPRHFKYTLSSPFSLLFWCLGDTEYGDHATQTGARYAGDSVALVAYEVLCEELPQLAFAAYVNLVNSEGGGAGVADDQTARGAHAAAIFASSFRLAINALRLLFAVYRCGCAKWQANDDTRAAGDAIDGIAPPPASPSPTAAAAAAGESPSPNGVAAAGAAGQGVELKRLLTDKKQNRNSGAF